MFAPWMRSRASALAVVMAAAGLAGCAAKVTRKDFDAEVARLRDEMQSGDRALATRIDSTGTRVADHDRRIAALEQDLQQFHKDYNVSIERMKGAIKFDVPVHFDFAKADVRDSDRAVLDRFASVVKEYYGDALVTVEGFTDPAGGTRYNQRLGLRRADAVREYLTSSGGLNAEKVRVVSYGEARARQVTPGAKGPGERGMENRRVALVVDYAGGETGPVAAAE
jgi:peptidoglycan-associated lipoprotein